MGMPGTTFNDAWLLDSNQEPFPSPFCDYASTVMPRSIREAISFSNYLFGANGIYGAVTERVIAYFLTDIDINGEDIGTDEKTKYENYFRKVLHYKVLLRYVTRDFMVDGNTFNSLLEPFRRYLLCKGCKQHERPLREIIDRKDFYQFAWQQCRFHAKCPGCGYRGDWKILDRVERDEKKIVIRRWNPKEITIRSSVVSGRNEYKWKIQQSDRDAIRRAWPLNPLQLEDTPEEVLDAVRENRDLLFDDKALFHWKNEYLSSVKMHGWGMPPAVQHFRQGWYIQVLHRLNEAIAMDYVIPARVISPTPGRGNDTDIGDVLSNLNAGGIMRMVERMIRQTRRDPARWHFSPIPLQYSIFGGDAKGLAPFELLDQGIGTLLNMMGYPEDFFKMSLQQNVAPVAARLMAALWAALVDGMVAFLQWVADATADVMLWEKVEVGLKKVEIVDSTQDPTLQLGLASQGLVSPTTALKSIGAEFKPEIRQKLDDERFIQEEQAKRQEEMDQSSAIEPFAPTPLQQMLQGAMQTVQGGPSGGGGGAAPAGGGAAPSPGMGPPGAGSPTPSAGGPQGSAAVGMSMATPQGPGQRPTAQESISKAQSWADYLMRMPEGMRHSQLTKLKQSDPLIHPVVKQMIDDMRHQFQQQGGAMLQQQTYGTA